MRIPWSRCAPTGYADYHPEMPGGKPGWRSHEALPLHASELGADFARLRPPHPAVQFLGRVSWTLEETGTLLFRIPGWRQIALSVFGNYLRDFPQRLRSRRDRRLTLGNALLGRLKLAAEQAGGELWLNSPLIELIARWRASRGALIEARRTTHARGARRGGDARGGWLRAQCRDARTVPAPLARAALERLADPTIPGEVLRPPMTSGRGHAQHGLGLVGHLDEPARRGARAPHGLRARTARGDHRQRPRRALHERGGLLPHRRPADARAAIAGRARTIPSLDDVRCASTAQLPGGTGDPGLAGLAAAGSIRAVLVRGRHAGRNWRSKTGLPPERAQRDDRALQRRARARAWMPDFKRGESVYDRYYGDRKVAPEPDAACARDRRPSTPSRVYPGDIGTNGGLATNENAQVLGYAGVSRFPGLYAAGNMAATVMGHSYPAAGATLGPGMTFGYIAARHLTALIRTPLT